MQISFFLSKIMLNILQHKLLINASKFLHIILELHPCLFVVNNMSESWTSFISSVHSPKMSLQLEHKLMQHLHNRATSLVELPSLG